MSQPEVSSNGIEATPLTGSTGAQGHCVRLGALAEASRSRRHFLDDCMLVFPNRFESQPILRFLHEHSVLPDQMYRHRWTNGDVVMWDDRCTMHHGVRDYGDDTVRELRRIRIKCTVPA